MLSPSDFYKKLKQDTGIKFVETSKDGNAFRIMSISSFVDMSVTRIIQGDGEILAFKDTIKGNIVDYRANFCIPSLATNIIIDKNSVYYNISGLHVCIVASDGIPRIKYLNSSDGHTVLKRVEFSQCTQEEVHYTVTVDMQGRDKFLSEQTLFLEKKMFDSIRKCVESPFMNNLFELCNISAIDLYRYGREMYIKHNIKEAHRIDILNKIINNCSIKSSCRIGEGSRIAYGGLGVLIHADSVVGKYCNIGSNVTLASAPIIGDYCYLSTGCRIIKNKILIGNFCIIGANSVVTKDVPSFSIVAGIPGRIIGKITPKNIDKYAASYFAWAHKDDSAYVSAIKTLFLELYGKE